MKEETMLEVRAINEEEMKLRDRKFKIMRELNVISWEAVQGEVIRHMMSKEDANANT